MAKWGEFEFDEFKQMADRFRDVLDKNVIDKWIREFLLEVAYRAVAKIKKRTPVGVYGDKMVSFTTSDGKHVEFFAKSHGKVGGTLRNNWDVGKVIKKGDSYEVEIFNNTEYAGWVEFGHRAGKKLNKWVEGRFMMTISMKEIERELPKFIERKQVELLNKLFGGKG